jgi:hypothetical protein
MYNQESLLAKKIQLREFITSSHMQHEKGPMPMILVIDIQDSGPLNVSAQKRKSTR